MTLSTAKNHLLLHIGYKSEITLMTPSRTLRCFPGDLHWLTAKNVHLLAVLLEDGAVSSTGQIKTRGHSYEEYVITIQHLPALQLEDKTVSATDIRGMQIAKATAAAAIQELIRKAGLTTEDVALLGIKTIDGEVCPSDAKRIGLIPKEMAEEEVPTGGVCLDTEVYDLFDDAASIHTYSEHLFFPKS